MTRITSIVYIGFLLFLNCIHLFAQTPSADPSQDILPPSPSAAAITKYVDFPVNTSTGIPSVSIPLGEVMGRGIAVPVSLDYHAGGVRVDDAASNVGMGWSFNAGGVISRSVMGLQDEDANGFMFRGNDVPLSPITDSLKFINLQGFAENNWDGQPDIFQFNFAGYSGKFIFDDASTVRFVPQQDLKISYATCASGSCPNGAPVGSIISITVTTPDGIQYLFGTNNAVEVSKSQNYNVSGSTGCRPKEFISPLVTAWYLSSITNPRTGEVVTFSYSAYNAQYDVSYNESFQYKDPTNDTGCPNTTVTSKCVTKKTDWGKTLTSIVSSMGRVDFNTNSTRSDMVMVSGNNRVTEVRFSGNENKLLKYYQLVQSFIQSSGTTPSTEPTTAYRMYLDTLKAFASDSVQLNKWAFEYYNRGSLPPRLSFKQDHWGYFNNKNNTQQMTPAPEGGTYSLAYIQSLIPSFIPANRNPDPAYSYYGNLKKVTYPTGGTALYEYEGNEIPVCTTVNVPTPGYQSAAAIYNGSIQTDIQYFTLDHDQYVTVGYHVLMNGFRCDGAYASIKKIDVNNPFQNKTWGGCGQMTNPVELSGSETFFMKAGDYKLEAVAQQGPAGQPYGSPFCCSPEEASISASFITNIATPVINKPVGGIRVKKITLADGLGNSPDVVKAYQYLMSNPQNCTGASSGIYMGNNPKYLSADYSIFEVTGDQELCSYVLCKKYRLSSSSLTSLVSFGGAIVNYRETWILDGANGENGKQYFRHELFSDGSSQKGPNYYNVFLGTPNVDFSWKSGKVVEEKTFSSTGQLIHQTLNDYEFNDTTGKKSIKAIVARKIFAPLCTTQFVYYCDGTNEEGEEYLIDCQWITKAEFPYLTYFCSYYYYPCYNQPAGTEINESTLALTPYAIEWYDIISQFVYLKKTTTRSYDSNGSGNFVETVTDYQYDLPLLRHHMPVKTIQTNSDGVQYATKTVYPPEYTTTTVSDIPSTAIKNLKDNFIINTPVEVVQTIKKPAQAELVTGGQLIKYKNFGGTRIFPNETWKIATTAPISGFTYSSISGGNFAADSRYYQTAQLGAYDAKGNLTEWNKKDDQVSSFIYGHGENRPIAYARNALSTEIAFTGFEESGQGSAQNGYWVISGTTGGYDTTATFVYTGKYGFNIGTSRTVTRSNLPAGSYLVSFFYRSGNIRINGINVNTSFTNNWAYAEKIVTLAGVGSISVTAAQSGTYIDELRLHPVDALVRTFSLDNNSLLLRSMSDENSVPAHFEYDKNQRLQVIRDQDRNIVQTYEYNYQQAGAALNDIKARTVLTSGQTTITQVNALSGANVRRVFQFLDGLGRPLQSNEVAQSPLQYDIITYQTYDAFGREPKKYLPYTIASNGGAYRSAAASEQNTFATTYGSGGYGYSETRFEASPMNRPLEQAAPGATWRIGQGHTNESLYRGNTVAEAVRDFTNNTNFPASQLAVAEATDENERKSYTYTDKLGRTVLTKQQLATSPVSEDNDYARTYIVYDDFGRVVAVIPPEAALKMKSSANWDWSSPTYASMIFKYAYDGRGRQITKSIPAAGATSTWYDRLDRPVLTLDPNGFKTFTRYDILGRPVLSGRYKGTATPGVSEPLYETPNTTAPHYYSTQSFPTDNNLDVYKVFYYDDYDLDNNGSVGTGETYTDPAESGYETAAFSRTRGKATAAKTAVLKIDHSTPVTYLTTRTYYDKEYSIIQVNKQNHLGGSDIRSSAYDFANRPIKTRRDHTATPPGGTLKSYVIREEYQYDHAGRLKYTLHQIGSQKKEIIAGNTYDELGRLQEKNLHAFNYDGITMPGSPSWLQSQDYTYNIRGWLTGLNDPTSCALQAGDNLADLFAMKLEYETTSNGGTIQYNGNINSQEWNTYLNGVCGTRQLYRYTYDGADRLTGAPYYTRVGSLWVSSTKYNESGLGYDLNGNIKSLNRRGLVSGSTFGLIDNLLYFYEDPDRPDRLTRITDSGNASKGFMYNALASSPHYMYDAKGNLTQDKHKGLTLAYNFLNLPDSISNGGGGNILLVYTADGEKLGKTAGGVTKNYVSGIEYSGANLEAIYHAEGRCTPNGSNFYYEYTLKDHLGNARVNFRANASAVVFLDEHHYYPFGMEMEGYSGTGGNLYRYNGKELNADLGLNWNDYGARWYDAAVGRWWSVDPLAEKFTLWSVFEYAQNNPIKLIDPNGMAADLPPGAIVTVEQLENGNFSHYLVSATVYTYGEASSSQVASDLTNQVNGIWNNSVPDEPRTSRYSSQEGSPVKFNISFIHVSMEEASKLAEENKDNRSVNFLKIVNDNNTDSRFDGNSGILNLQQNSERGFTTGAHEIGHMMGFKSEDTNDKTHITDDLLNDNNGDIPIMYSGGRYVDKLDERSRTKQDMQGLNIWDAIWKGDGYIGDPNLNNPIRK